MRALASCALVFALSTTSACAQEQPDDAVTTAIALTRKTSATYSLYTWNIITRSGNSTEQEWSAEFHQGNLHRVETPRDRIVADCAAMTGTYLQVETGEIVQGPNIARAACGIQSNSKVLEARITGERDSKFGKTRTVWIRDPDSIRTYDIAENGALVAATIDDLESNHLLKAYAIELVGTVPSGIFEQESLARSVVPERYKTVPSQ